MCEDPDPAARPAAPRPPAPRARLTVLKLGGSVLRAEEDLPHAVAAVQRARRGGAHVVAVVSAFHGATDRLLARARGLGSGSASRALAPLLASGEQRAAALLVLALEAAGAPAVLLEPWRVGLRALGACLEASPVALDRAPFHAAFARGEVAVLPGFHGVAADGGTALFGRGGSDLSALFVAARLGAADCVLLKDAGGVFEADPREHPGARRYRDLTWRDAARLGGRIVQPRALAWARSQRRPFSVASIGGETLTRVGTRATRFAPAPAAQPLPSAESNSAISSRWCRSAASAS